MEKFLSSKRFWVGIVLFILGVSFVAANVITRVNAPPKPKEVPLGTFISELKKTDSDKIIDEVKIDDTRRIATIKYKDKDKRTLTSNYPLQYGSVLFEVTEDEGLELKVTNTDLNARSFTAMLISMVPSFLIIGLIVWFAIVTLRGGKSSKSVSVIPETRFKDLAGVDEAVADMGEITDFLKDTSKFREIGAKTPKGALLAGPPGTGKTLLARAVAGEAGVPFYQTSGSDFVEMFVGMGARRVRNLFKEANKHESAIIFIDEIDAIGGKRSQGDGADAREHNRTINALLTQMDGFEESNVIVLAATNSPDSLDPALVRAGRFDRKISVDLPDWKGRLGILKIHTRDKPLAEDVDLDVVAKSTVGLAGADLAALANEALINAVRMGREAAAHEDFMEALSTVTLGRAKKSVAMTEKDKQIVAAHEAGHAVVGLAEDKLPDPSHVSITPRGFSGGHTKLPESDDKFQTEASLKARLSMIFGGYVAEKFIFGEITQGPGHDLAAATDLATQMITKLGMGSTLTVLQDQEYALNAGLRTSIQIEINALLDESLARSEKVFADPKWRWAFEEIQSQLLKKETLEQEDIVAIKAKALNGDF